MSANYAASNPFPGLRPFRQDEDYLFFGREEQTLELLQRLGSHRFVAVVGNSGSGKSSLVRCGLISELLGGKLLRAGSSWEVAVTHPGGNPIALLAESILEAGLYDAAKPDAREQLLATLSRSHFGLVEAVRQARLPLDTNFLLVVDQFEEIFRFHDAGQTQQDVASEFVAMLLEAVGQVEIPIFVVLTMRSDFIGECGQFDGLAELVNRGEFLIPRLSREQYKLAIEAPVKVAGGKIAPRLLQRLLNDLGQQSDQLPCLQHALMRTWEVAHERDRDAVLDLQDYDRVGRMSQALSIHADEVFEGLTGDRQQLLCAGLFRALTVKESEQRGIRRPQRLGMICRILDATPAEMLPIIDAYRRPGVSFLTPPLDIDVNEQTIIDISHESLMRVWNRLRHWVEEEAQAADIYRRLSESAMLSAQGKAGLYRDPELGIALSWREQCRPNEAWASRYQSNFAAAMQFLDSSQSAAAQAATERELVRQRELQQANQLAETQRLRADEQKRAATRMRGLALGLAALTILAIFAFVYALISQRDAERNAATAINAQNDAINAAKSAQSALADASEARDEAQRANEDERRQREVAETQTQAAIAARQQLEIALTAAETARRDAESAQSRAVAAQQRAELAQQQAEDDRQLAAEAEQRAIADRKLAEHEKALADSSAELARRREKLFEKLLPLLQEHASSGVLQYARRLERDGKPLQALQSLVDFCDLVLGDATHEGSALQLLHLDTFALQGIETAAIDVNISVPPSSLFSDVVMPGIELGEQLFAANAEESLRLALLRLHKYRTQILTRFPSEDWRVSVSVPQMLHESFDRLTQLEPQQFAYFLGRAAARFRLPERSLPAVLEDLDAAGRLFRNEFSVTDPENSDVDRRRQLAGIYLARGNVLEHLANELPPAERQRRHVEAEKAYRLASRLDAESPNILVAVARILRKRGQSLATLNERQTAFSEAKATLAQAMAIKADLAEGQNELGEVMLSQAMWKEARTAFQQAVRIAKSAPVQRQLYTYNCNLANAWLRDATERSNFEQALSAANEALELKLADSTDAHYLRGSAFWKLGQKTDAIAEFALVLEQTPTHQATLLARAQLIFEMTDPDVPSDAQLKQAYSDVRALVADSSLDSDSMAKAQYVYSLGWLRRHVREKSEDSLVRCLEYSLKCCRAAPSYLAFARQVFGYAAALTWRDRDQRQQAEKLQAQFKVLNTELEAQNKN